MAVSDSTSPPPYTRVIPEVDILFLGSPGVGKSTFLSRLNPQLPSKSIASQSSQRLDLERRPFKFDVSLFRRPYTFRIWPSTGTLFVDEFPDNPRLVIICYDVSDRTSLHNARYYWRRQFTMHYQELEHTTPVLLLGLKRDLRTDQMDEKGQYTCIMPQEGVNEASEMRCDSYCECSAVTGELLWEAVEDITRIAAKTTTEKGGLSEGSACALM